MMCEPASNNGMWADLLRLERVLSNEIRERLALHDRVVQLEAEVSGLRAERKQEAIHVRRAS